MARSDKLEERRIEFSGKLGDKISFSGIEMDELKAAVESFDASVMSGNICGGGCNGGAGAICGADCEVR